MATDSSIGSGYGFDLRFDEVAIYKDQPLGSGAYGIVCKAKCDQLPCAAKLLHPTFLVPGNWAVDKFMQECSFLASLKHPHIVQFLGVHTETSTSQVALFMELMDESLTTFLNRYHSSDQSVPFNIQVDICHDIVLALHYLHTNGIIHRDLSSNNVLLLGGRRAKITDFGMSKLTMNSSSLSSLTQVPGCPVYMPPEAWLTPPVYSEKLDMFSFGVLIIQIITCRQPNPGPSESLLPDERSPTGFIKLPVHELERRNEDIMIIPSDHHLKESALKCLSDKAENRPSSKDICQLVENIKSSEQYSICNVQSHSTMSSTCAPEPNPNSQPDPKNEIDDLKKVIQEKESEIQNLKGKVSSLQTEVSKLQGELITTELQSQSEAKTCTKPELKPKKEPLNNPTDRYAVLTGLSPEVLSAISRDSEACLPRFNLSYDINQGQVKFKSFREFESKEQNLRIFLQFYQYIFNSCQLRVEFFPIPESLPASLLRQIIVSCAKQQNRDSFQHIEVCNVLKIISRSPEMHKLNLQMVTNLLNLQIDLGGGRKLILKKGNIVEEDASIIVSSANPPLQHRIGVSAAINAASLFEVQKHANIYVQKHGPIEIGNIAYTKAGGNLKCDWIIHAVGPTGILFDDKKLDPDFRKDVIDTLKELMHKILSKAEELRATSIAIPAISTGSLQLALTVAASGIFEGICEHKFSHSSRLVDIRIIIVRKDIFMQFAEILINHQLKVSLAAKEIEDNWSSPTVSASSVIAGSISSCKQQ